MECYSENQIIEGPNLKSYHICIKTSTSFKVKQITCERKKMFNSTLGGCHPVPGGGNILCVLHKKKCPEEKGIIPHPNENLYKQYLICEPEHVIVCQCPTTMHYDKKLKKCVKADEKPETKLIYSECHPPPHIECEVPGVFLFNNSTNQDNNQTKCADCYYLCNERNLNLFELTILCPNGQDELDTTTIGISSDSTGSPATDRFQETTEITEESQETLSTISSQATAVTEDTPATQSNGSTKLIYSECHPPPDIECEDSGLFYFDNSTNKNMKCANCYYLCNLNNNNIFELTISCPENAETTDATSTLNTITEVTEESQVTQSGITKQTNGETQQSQTTEASQATESAASNQPTGVTQGSQETGSAGSKQTAEVTQKSQITEGSQPTTSAASNHPTGVTQENQATGSSVSKQTTSVSQESQATESTGSKQTTAVTQESQGTESGLSQQTTLVTEPSQVTPSTISKETSKITTSGTKETQSTQSDGTTKLIYSECKPPPHIECKESGLFHFENTSNKHQRECPGCYYLCNENDLNVFELTILCPKTPGEIETTTVAITNASTKPPSSTTGAEITEGSQGTKSDVSKVSPEITKESQATESTASKQTEEITQQTDISQTAPAQVKETSTRASSVTSKVTKTTKAACKFSNAKGKSNFKIYLS